MAYFSFVGFLIIIGTVYSATNHTNLDTRDSTKGQLFDAVRFGISLSGVETEILTTNAVGDCLLLCMRDTNNNNNDCKSISFDSVSKECHLNKIAIEEITSGPSIRPDDASVYITVKNDDPWTMLFRAASGIEKNVLEAWNNVGHYDDDSPFESSSFGCITVDGRLPCDRHFRFKQFDDIIKFKEVKYAFYKDAIEEIYITFAVRNDTTWSDVLQFDRIVDSSYEQLVNYSGPCLQNVSIVEGLMPCEKNISLSPTHQEECHCGQGWLIVSEPISPDPMMTNPSCDYGIATPKPQFLYSSSGGPMPLSPAHLASADTFVVFAKI